MSIGAARPLQWGAIVLALLAWGSVQARADFSENFDSGSATFTANDPYWLDNNASNGFVTQTTNNPAIWPGFPAGFGADIPQDVSGKGYFLFDGTYLYPDGTTNIPAGKDQFYISPSFSVVPNTTYAVSFWLTSANGINSPSVQPELGGSLLGSAVSPIGTYGSDGWQQFVFSWYSGSNTSASLILHDYTPTASGNDFGLDEIKVQATPEPSALVVLLAALAPAGLLARRRRA